MALLAVFAAIGIITATGAFTSVTADRTATVEVSGDASANLQLVPYDGPNGYNDGNAGSSNGYADIKSGTLEINLAGYNNGNAQSTGVNLNATTEYDNVFVITNNANQSVDITITPEGNNPGAVAFYNGTTDSGTNVSGTAFNLGSGNSQTISISVDTNGLSLSGGESLINNIEINAENTQA